MQPFRAEGQKKEALSGFSLGVDSCILAIQLDDFVSGHGCLMLSVCGCVRISGTVKISIVKVFDKVFNHCIDNVTTEFDNVHVLGSVDKFCQSEFNSICMLKVDKVAMVGWAGMAVNRACIVGKIASPKSCSCFGVCSHAVGKGDKDGVIETSNVVHRCGVDVVNVSNMEMRSAVVAHVQIAATHKIVNAYKLLANCVQSFVNRAFVFHVYGAVVSRKESEVQQFTTSLCSACGRFEFTRVGEAVCLAVALSEVVFVVIAFSVGEMEIAHITEAVATLCDFNLMSADRSAVVAHTDGSSCHCSYILSCLPFRACRWGLLFVSCIFKLQS